METWQPDAWIYDDKAIVIHVSNKGLAVATGCGHAGVMNVLRQARSQTGVEQIYALIGVFRLTGALFEPMILQTVDALKQIEPEVIVPAHCNGWRATQGISLSETFSFHPDDRNVISL